ncbi:MAG: non-ribosomal peptide synthetase, partial [Gemmatimonadetes bacterium]|nr:non-ribosomal peptide synthetase [Gemmatimonadota bacterium]
ERRLVGYVVPEGEAPGAGELRAFLGERLPEYMVPTAWMSLAELPRREQGKLDRRALPPPPAPEAEQARAAPGTPVEEVLCRIWAELLRVEQVGVHDNFFELGGDSILTIQAVARAYRAGVPLTPRQLFEHQTIAALAAAVGKADVVLPERGVLAGEVPLSPIQQWFFARELPEPHHFNQATAWNLRERVDAARMERALHELLRQHDALRLRFSCEGAGPRQWYDGLPERVPFERVDLAGLPADEVRARRRETADRMHRTLDLTAGPVLRAALFEHVEGSPQELLVVAHHLAVDGVSWRILMADWEAAYRQLGAGEEVRLGAKTASYRQWMQQLARDAQSSELADELVFWLAQEHGDTASLPPACGPGPNTVGTLGVVELELDEEHTGALVHGFAAERTNVEEVLLAGLALALARESGRTDVRVELEGHGRETAGGAVDLSRTVGWFTARYPVRLEVDPAEEPEAALRSVRAQLREVPRRGIGYGVLRYLAPREEVRARLAALPKPEVGFNYLGRFDTDSGADGLFAPTRAYAGRPRSARGVRAHRLEVLSSITPEGRLRMAWQYSERLDRRETIERLAGLCEDALRSLAARASPLETGEWTPEHFPGARLDQAELDSLLKMIAE